MQDKRFLNSSNLSVPHGFFTRNGGVGEGIFASLNCALGSSDSIEHARENRRRVAAQLGISPEHLLGLYQVHGDHVVTALEAWPVSERPEADAMVTATPGLALSILTADCVPILFADTRHGVIGAAHAGWKGVLADIPARTIEAMCALGAERGAIAAAIGPCIGQASYEVGGELRERFLTRNAAFSRSFIPGEREGLYQFDIGGAARSLLEKAGITRIDRLEHDTYLEEDQFFSFRRATHRREPDYGRQISAIVFK